MQGQKCFLVLAQLCRQLQGYIGNICSPVFCNFIGWKCPSRPCDRWDLPGYTVGLGWIVEPGINFHAYRINNTSLEQ